MSDSLRPGWISCSFSALCQQIVNGGTPDTGNPSYWNGTTPWITGADFTERGIGEFRRYVSGAGIRGSATSVVRQGNLLVVTRTGVGKIAIAPCDIAISQDVTGIYLDSDKVEINFAYYLLKRELDELKKLNQGTSINGIVRSDLERHRVQIPESKITQAKIARVLLRIDSAIEKTEALIEKYQQIKAGLMHDLFTRGVLPDGKLRPTREQAPELYKKFEPNWVPNQWQVTRLGDICEIYSGGTPSRLRGAYWGGDIPWVKTGEVRYEKIFDTEEKITKSGLDSSSARIFEKDTVVMAMYGEGNTRGRVAILGVPCATNQACAGFVFSDSIESIYMYYFFEYSYEDLRDLSNDGSQKNLSASLLREFPVRYPSKKSERQAIACRLLALDSLLTKEKVRLKKLLSQKYGLMHDLLTGKVAVKVNEAQEEHV